jgi:pyridoxine 5-phosphate synthase
MNSILLGVNLDHVATLRQVRSTTYPDLIESANLAIAANADSITLHLREDRRHIQDKDVVELKSSLTVPMNLELAITEEMLEIAEHLQPKFCCFVPERREELTTEGGLDVVDNKQKVVEACSRMKDAGIRPSLFLDADPKQIEAAAESGAKVIEIHTGHYAEAYHTQSRMLELKKITDAIIQATSLGLQVNAGHGLNYDNVNLIAEIREVHELNIGHSIIAQAVFDGLEVAVQKMKRLMEQSRL